MIVLKDVAKGFPGGTQALRGVSLTVEAGEFVALLGPSGAGKSTLLRCINGLVPDFQGSARVDGITVRPGPELREVRRRVGMVFQQFNLAKRISVLENVLCGRLGYASGLLSSLRLFAPDDVEMALEALARVGLADKAHVRADQLSGGQQQRVGIARALVQRPRAILADEPVASLDPVSSRIVLGLLAEINQRDGVTVVTSLHDPRLALEFGHRIVGLSHGRLVFDRPAAAVTPADMSLIYERPIDRESGLEPEEELAVARS